MKNAFVQKYLEENDLTVLHCDEEKPWGAYYVLEETLAFDKKILWIKPGEFLSLQYHGSQEHKGHSEKGIALTDMMLVLGNEDVSGLTLEEIYDRTKDLKIIKLKKGEAFETPSGFLHAYVNPYDHDVYLTEIRTSEIPEGSHDREGNIIRIYDVSRRGGVPEWPKWLVDEILRK